MFGVDLLLITFKKASRYLFWFLPLLPLQCGEPHNQAQEFVTYDFSGGRFGDNLIAYLHAKWHSYRHKVPLLYKPFPYSSQLVLHDRELHYSQVDLTNFREVSVFDDEQDLAVLAGTPKLHLCPYFPEGRWELENLRDGHGRPWSYFETNWSDPGFRQLLQELVALKMQYKLTIPPKDTINIAIHYREGGGFDTGDFALGFITKFPPIEFYIEGLLKTITLFPGKPLYCYLFTDAIDPSECLEKIKYHIPSQVPITFDCREKKNIHNQNVLEDFFSLFEFDVLIHSQSNFSLIPSLIHEYAVSYMPLSGHPEGRMVKIDKVKLTVNEKPYRKLLNY